MNNKASALWLLPLLSPAVVAQTFNGEGIIPEQTSTYLTYPVDPATGQQIEVECTSTVGRRFANLTIDLDLSSASVDIETTVSDIIGDPMFCGTPGTSSQAFNFANVAVFDDGVVLSNSTGSLLFDLAFNTDRTDVSGEIVQLTNGGYRSGWAAASQPGAASQCAGPIGIGEILAGLDSGFDVDPGDPASLTPIFQASSAIDTRGYLDVEIAGGASLVSLQCETDHMAIYVWFAGLPTAPDLVRDVELFRDGFEVSLFIDGGQTGVMDFAPYIGASPISGTLRGILKVAAILEPGDLDPGIHYAEIQLRSQVFFDADFRAGFFVRDVSELSQLDALIDSVESLGLRAGQTFVLTWTLRRAKLALENEGPTELSAAIARLRAIINLRVFIWNVRLLSGRSIETGQADQLISQAEQIVGALLAR